MVLDLTWLKGSKGLYAAVTGVDHMQQGKRVIAGSARMSKFTGLIHGKRKCRVQQSLKLGEESGKKMFAGHGSEVRG